MSQVGDLDETLAGPDAPTLAPEATSGGALRRGDVVGRYVVLSRLGSSVHTDRHSPKRTAIGHRNDSTH